MLNLFSKIKENFSGKKDNKKCFCYMPLIHAFISGENNVYTCPECMVKNSLLINLGNLQEENFNKIWNGSFAKQFRTNAKNNVPSFCPLLPCANKSNFHMQVLSDFMKKGLYNNNCKSPQIVTFGNDIKSIYNCTMAEEEQSEYDTEIKEKYFEALKDAKYVVFCSETDPFSSKKTSSLIKEIAEKFPQIKFNFVSNGILFNKEICDSLGITDRIENVLIFINAANKETYDKYVHNGNYEELIKNLTWLKELKDTNKLSNLFFAYLIDTNNYKDMTTFINFANNYNAVVIFEPKITLNKSLGGKTITVDDESIISPLNEHYAEFINTLNSKEIDNEKVILTYTLSLYKDAI